MAEETNANQANTLSANGDGGNQTPTVEELMAQLAEEQNKNRKNKLALDKALKETGDMKKQLRARQTAEEQEAEEKAEREREIAERLEKAEKENNRFKAIAAYKSLDEKTVDTLLEAVADGDHASIANIIDSEVQKAVKTAQAEWLKSRPPVSSGAYSGMSRDDIMAISDRGKRREAMAQNMDLFR